MDQAEHVGIAGPLSRTCRAWVWPSLAVGAILLALALPVTVPSAAAQPTQRDLLDTIRADARFSTLVRAVEVAGLAETLAGPGPYTFFAPTNDAFGKLPGSMLDRLLNDPEAMRRVLTYHLAPDVVTAAQVVQVPSVPNVQGQQIKVAYANDTLLMNNATVLERDRVASNGVIHVVDTLWVNAALGPGTLPVAGVAGDPHLTAALIGAALIAVGLALRRCASCPA